MPEKKLFVDDKKGAYVVRNRRRAPRRQSDKCVMTQEQLEKLLRKVDQSHDAILRGEGDKKRLTAVEDSVSKLCDRFTKGMLAIIGTLFVGTGTLIAAIWHIVTWIQELINRTLVLA